MVMRRDKRGPPPTLPRPPTYGVVSGHSYIGEGQLQVATSSNKKAASPKGWGSRPMGPVAGGRAPGAPGRARGDGRPTDCDELSKIGGIHFLQPGLGLGGHVLSPHSGEGGRFPLPLRVS
jgi:hypothetical protein